LTTTLLQIRSEDPDDALPLPQGPLAGQEEPRAHDGRPLEQPLRLTRLEALVHVDRERVDEGLVNWHRESQLATKRHHLAREIVREAMEPLRAQHRPGVHLLRAQPRGRGLLVQHREGLPPRLERA